MLETRFSRIILIMVGISMSTMVVQELSRSIMGAGSNGFSRKEN